VTAAIVLISGGAWDRAIVLGVSMTALQGSIGALNDLVDAPRDAVGQPWKPIPAGLVRPGTARLLWAAFAVLGVGLTVPLGWALAGTAVLVLGIGYAYDLRLKGTRWSWLPFAVGIPILPVFAWLGARGSLPALFAVLVPTAVAAGAALAFANSLVDLDGDRAAGADSPAQAWGSGWTRAVAVGLLAAVAAVAAVSGAAVGLAAPAVVAIAVVGAIPVAAGRWLSSPVRLVRERAWEAQAAGVGLLATAWLASLAAGGLLGTP
jgi:4-hydroxybenzoate polyprenyltransferase